NVSDLRRQNQAKRRDYRKNPIDALSWYQRHHDQAANAPAKQPESFRGHLAKNRAQPPVPATKIDNRKRDHQDAPWSKFVQQMWQIKVKRLRPMDRFAKTRHKFPYHHFIEETGLKKNSGGHPQEEDTQRSNPRPPAA